MIIAFNFRSLKLKGDKIIFLTFWLKWKVIWAFLKGKSLKIKKLMEDNYFLYGRQVLVKKQKYKI